jgi:four helix bundle protein
MNNSFRDLKIWQKGYELLMKVYEITSKYPIEEKYGLVIDTRKSANSVISNIAESHGRYFFKDQIRVLYVARGEIEEVRSHLSVALGREYLSKEDFNFLDKEYEGLGVGINFYIRDLEKQHQEAIS